METNTAKGLVQTAGFQSCKIDASRDGYSLICEALTSLFDVCPKWLPVYEWKIHIKKSKWQSEEKDHFFNEV